MASIKRHDRWQSIETVVGELGEASREQIQPLLPPQLGLSGSALGKVLRRMDKGSRLERVRHGVFRLHPNHALRSLSMFQFMEGRILRVLRECGGIAKREDIDNALWHRRRGAKERPYEYNLITRTLKESDKFQQDFGYGYWNLDETERSMLPLPGYWASYNLTHGIDDLDASTQLQVELFKSVGDAFGEARNACGLDLESAANDPAVREALRKIERSSGSLKNEALAEVRDMAQADAERLGISGGPAAYELLRARKADLSTTIYALFELGRPSAHIFADASFYRACGALYGVCPAKLSRGQPMP